MEEYKRKPNVKCKICQTMVYRRPSILKINNGRAFCSQKCYGFSNRVETPCVMCGAPIPAGAHKINCSRACANKYRTGIRYKLGRPRDKVAEQRALKIRLFEQRGAKCERCGYAKQEILHVHHKDRNRANNELNNLELICPNCHYEEHYLEKSWLRRVAPNGKAPVLKTGGRKPL